MVGSATLGVTNVADEDYNLNSFPLTLFGQPGSEKQPGAAEGVVCHD